jgi:hypothetical protein
MAWFKKKPDPIKDRARLLESEIAALEAEIKQLDFRLQRNDLPRLRSTATPGNLTRPADQAVSDVPDAPIFEEINHGRLEAGEIARPEHYNELGVRKYDLPALLRRLKNHLRGPATTNPKLVSYLAAGGIQGLRPMRYEKRVARNRFIALVILLFFTMLGLIAALVRQG